MSRFGDGEHRIFASGRPLNLFDEGFVSSKKTIKECIFEAMPGFPPHVADILEQTAKDHIAFDACAKDLIRRHGLTPLEAEAVVWWTSNVNTLSGSVDAKDSPYNVYNAVLRAREANSIRMWRDFSYYFISALQKLPVIQTTSFRGEKKRVTELSKQYVKDNQVVPYEIDSQLGQYPDKPFVCIGDMDIFQLDDDGQQTDPATVWQWRNVLQAFYFRARYQPAELVPRRERASSVAKLGFQGHDSPLIARGELWSPSCVLALFYALCLL
jgi:hypothetical protein